MLCVCYIIYELRKNKKRTVPTRTKYMTIFPPGTYIRARNYRFLLKIQNVEQDFDETKREERCTGKMSWSLSASQWLSNCFCVYDPSNGTWIGLCKNIRDIFCSFLNLNCMLLYTYIYSVFLWKAQLFLLNKQQIWISIAELSRLFEWNRKSDAEQTLFSRFRMRNLILELALLSIFVPSSLFFYDHLSVG